MRARWTWLARSDLEQIQKYIKEHNPPAALKVGARIHDAVRRLEQHPQMGRPGTVPGTREKLALPYPYVIVYEVVEDRE